MAEKISLNFLLQINTIYNHKSTFLFYVNIIQGVTHENLPIAIFPVLHDQILFFHKTHKAKLEFFLHTNGW